MLTHWKRLWCWERLGAGGEGDDRGWDGWMASLTRWTWVWVNSGSWWWTGRPGVLRFMGSQRVGHDWVTELNWTDTRARTLGAPTDLFIICMFMRDIGLPSSCLIMPLSGFVIWVMQINFENAFYSHVFLSPSFSTDFQMQIPGWIVDRNIWLKRIME